jgi:hypothetical protein
MDHPSPVVSQDHKDEQHLERHRGHGEEVHGDQAPEVVVEVRQVCDGGLRWWTMYLDTAACEIATPSFCSSP